MIGRNDPCICGSGKKYKKCCMEKENVVDMKQVKEERFFRLKMELVENVREFLLRSLTFHEEQALRREYNERVGHAAAGANKEAGFDHWLIMIHQFESGLRGFEWFAADMGRRVKPELLELAASWSAIVPRLIQMTDSNEAGVFVEDVFTKERFYMPFCETLPEMKPWMGSFCLIEESNGGYYINGVAAFVSPEQVGHARRKLEALIQETKTPYEKAAREYFPEIYASLLQKVKVPQEKSEISMMKLTYRVPGLEELHAPFNTDNRMIIEEWTGGSAKLNFVQNFYRYQDNAANGELLLSEISGNITIAEQLLTYETLEPETAESFKQWMFRIPGAVFAREEVETIEMPVALQAKQYAVYFPESMPQNFAIISQTALHLNETDVKIPLLGNRSPEGLVEAGDTATLEEWLREQEYRSYIHLRRAWEGAEGATADFNAVRRKLGLPLSPFVTMGDKRRSSIQKVEQRAAISEEEIPYYQELDLSQQAAQKFFAADLVEFFKEKAIGKSSNTFYKYRLALMNIGYYFDRATVPSWQEADEEHWRELLAFEFLNNNFDATANQVKGFFSVIKSFVSWLDKKYGTKKATMVRDFAGDIEQSILAAVEVLESYTPYHLRRYEVSGDIHRAFTSAMKNFGESVQGEFQLVKKLARGASFKQIGGAGNSYSVSVPASILPLMETGIVIGGSLIKEGTWKFTDVQRVFPPLAARYFK